MKLQLVLNFSCGVVADINKVLEKEHKETLLRQCRFRWVFFHEELINILNIIIKILVLSVSVVLSTVQ